MTPTGASNPQSHTYAKGQNISPFEVLEMIRADAGVSVSCVKGQWDLPSGGQ